MFRFGVNQEKIIPINVNMALNYACDNTYKEFTYSNFTYNVNKCDITYMFFNLLLNVNSFIRKISYKKCHNK
jgi:hypothetical protein